MAEDIEIIDGKTYQRISTSQTVTIPVDGTATYLAYYAAQPITETCYNIYTSTVDMDGNSINAKISPGSQLSIGQGGSKTLTAGAVDGYEFSAWYNGTTLVSTTQSYTVSNIQSNISLIAKYKKLSDLTIIVTYKDTSGNTISTNSSGTYDGYKKNQSVRLIANYIKGYVFEGWYIDNVEVDYDRVYDTTITEDINIEARYKNISDSCSKISDSKKYIVSGSTFKDNILKSIKDQDFITSVQADGQTYNKLSDNAHILIDNSDGSTTIESNYYKLSSIFNSLSNKDFYFTVIDGNSSTVKSDNQYVMWDGQAKRYYYQISIKDLTGTATGTGMQDANRKFILSSVNIIPLSQPTISNTKICSMYISFVDSENGYITTFNNNQIKTSEITNGTDYIVGTDWRKISQPSDDDRKFLLPCDTSNTYGNFSLEFTGFFVPWEFSGV